MEYRLYFLDETEHITEFFAFEEESDEAAIAVAARQSRDRPVELWNRDRLVVRSGAAGLSLPDESNPSAKTG